MSISAQNICRALRLPFVSVSVLAFIFGSLLPGAGFDLLGFCLGLMAVVGLYLGANLINDYADSKSGADWQDRRFYKFFGGSKLIQEKIFSEKLYLGLAVSFLVSASAAIVTLALLLSSILIAGYYLLILLLAVFYTLKPLQVAYRRLGEVIIFVLFGPALVIGGYFIQTGFFPVGARFILSFPFGFLTTAILFAHEVSDFDADQKAGKLTWVALVSRENAYLVYYGLVGASVATIILAISLGYLSLLSALSLLAIFPAIKAAAILQHDYADKNKLLHSSRLTIAVHNLTAIVLILDLLI